MASAMQLPPWRRLPRIESSGDYEEEEMEDGFELFRQDVGPDVKDMANSFADLVSPDNSPTRGGQGTERQWWQPLDAHPLGRTPSKSCSASGPDLGGIAEEPDSGAPAGPGKVTLNLDASMNPSYVEAGGFFDERRLAEFLYEWGLDAKCEQTIRSMPLLMQSEVFSSFKASSETRNVNAKFMAWVSSKMRSFHDFESCLVTSLGEREAFYRRWSLDFKCCKIVEEQPAHVQRELISNFNPPPGTKNVAGKMTAFLNMILSKTRLRNNLECGPVLVEPPRIFQDQPAWIGVDPEVYHFMKRWGLDDGAKFAIMSVPEEARQAVMAGFNPSTNTEFLSRKFVSYVKSVLEGGRIRGPSAAAGAQMQGQSAADTESRSSRRLMAYSASNSKKAEKGRGRGGGRHDSQKSAANAPLSAGVVTMPARW